MTDPTEHLDWPTLVDYWAGDLTVEAEASHEAHLFGCETCTVLSARVAAVTESLRNSIPPLLTPEALAKLRAKGLTIVENPMQPGERRKVRFEPHVDILLHQLTGLQLEHAARVSFTFRVEETDQTIVMLDDAPFDREHGSVLIACQRHFAGTDPNMVAEVRVHDADGGEHLSTYTILHEWIYAEETAT